MENLTTLSDNDSKLKTILADWQETEFLVYKKKNYMLYVEENIKIYRDFRQFVTFDSESDLIEFLGMFHL